MLTEVRKYAEAHDIKGLRYVFVDSLDVDPTFEKYREDYEYCKSIPGLFDDHQALSGIITDESKWTSQYWEQLKLELMKNFSEVRFEHMIAVARIVYADKIARLQSERDAARTKSNVVSTAGESFGKSDNVSSENVIHTPKHVISEANAPKPISDAELQERRIAEKRRELADYNKRIEIEEAAKAAKRNVARQESLNKQNIQNGSYGSKKVMGIVLVIIVIVVVVLIVKALQ